MVREIYIKLIKMHEVSLLNIL